MTSLPLIPAKAGTQVVQEESRGRRQPRRSRISLVPSVPAFAEKSGGENV